MRKKQKEEGTLKKEEKEAGIDLVKTQIQKLKTKEKDKETRRIQTKKEIKNFQKEEIFQKVEKARHKTKAQKDKENIWM